MAEYSREQRNQLSRAIANNEPRSKQLKGVVDNREGSSFFKTSEVTQMGGGFSKPIEPPIINQFEVVPPEVIDGRSIAFVGMDVLLTDPTQKIFYEIKWDANVVPGGTHLGQIADTASDDFVIDKDPEGRPITDGLSDFSIAHFFDSEFGKRTHFLYVDEIQQRELNGGSWWFRLRITDNLGNDLNSQIVEINWRH